MKPFHVTIQKIVQETPRVISFYFHYPLFAEPGQYVLVDIPEYGERPFGAVIVDDTTFLISVGKVGAGTGRLHEMKEGEELSMKGPLGSYFTLPSSKEHPIALIAGGYGMAPLGFLARVAAEKGYQVHVFAGARSGPVVSDEKLAQIEGKSS